MMEIKIALLTSVFILHCLASSIQLTSPSPVSSSSSLRKSSLTLPTSLFSVTSVLDPSLPFHAEPTNHHLPLSSIFSMSSKLTLIASRFLELLIEPNCFLSLLIMETVFTFSIFLNLLFFKSVIVSIKNLVLVEILTPLLSFSLTDLVSSVIMAFKAVESSVLSLDPHDLISFNKISVFNSVGLTINFHFIMSYINVALIKFKVYK